MLVRDMFILSIIAKLVECIHSTSKQHYLILASTPQSSLISRMVFLQIIISNYPKRFSVEDSTQA